MSREITRRRLFRLASAATASIAMMGAVRAEGGLLHLLDQTPQRDDPDPGTLPFANLTPIRCGQAALRVRDLSRMVGFYRDSIGLQILEQTGGTAILGVDDVPLLHLLSRPDAPVETSNAAGLFHIAFLMPTRTDLAKWLVHAAYTQIQITGFADHSVSEAIYLDDPEGNGLEIYADRPKERWHWSGDVVTMGTHPLNIDAILELTDTTQDSYVSAPGRLRIGHMHLRVGNIGSGRSFYQETLGLDSTRGNDRPDSAFLSSGGYHHHVAMNVWNSSGAGMRDSASTGLDWFSLHIEDHGRFTSLRERLANKSLEVLDIANGIETRDPWGTALRLLTA